MRIVAVITDPYIACLAGSGGAMVALYRNSAERDGAWRSLGADPAVPRGETLETVPGIEAQ